jgi:hypothetical protein
MIVKTVTADALAFCLFANMPEHFFQPVTEH